MAKHTRLDWTSYAIQELARLVGVTLESIDEPLKRVLSDAITIRHRALEVDFDSSRIDNLIRQARDARAAGLNVEADNVLTIAKLKWIRERGWESLGIAGIGELENGIAILAIDNRARDGATRLLSTPPSTEYKILDTGHMIACRRPAQGGDPLSTPSGLTGTFGCLVKDDQGDNFILSCNHVLADLNKAKQHTTEIWQPGRAAHGKNTDRIGLLHDFAMLHIGGIQPNIIDAALCKPDSQTDVTMGFTISGIDNAPPFHTDVIKTGWKTKTTQGILQIKNLSFVMEIQSQDILMEGQFGLLGTSRRSFAEDGDSGAIVRNLNDEVVGMIIAAASAHNLAVATPIEEITTYFDVSI